MTKKERVNKAFNSVAIVIIIGIILFLKNIFFYYNTIANNDELYEETILGTIYFIIVIVCLISSLPNRSRVITCLVVDFLISLLLFIDHSYYVYSNNMISIAQITNLQYGEEIMSTLPKVITWSQILYFIDIIIILVCIIGKIFRIEKKEIENKKIYIARIVTAIIGICIFVFCCKTYIDNAKLKPYNRDLQVRGSTILGYHIYDVINNFTMKQQAKYKDYETMIQDYNQLKEKYQTRYGQESYPIKGILEGKNVIIVQLESIQEFVLHKRINGKPITPNLNKFLEENIEFSNMNMQSYSSTADSEHSTITSIYPMENGMSFSKYFTNTYDDIFKLFNQKDYHTSYMHGNEGSFWNRGNVYNRLGLDDVVFKEKFEDQSEYISGYLSDEIVYKQAVQKWKGYKEPFFSYVVAASSHTPFVLAGLADRSKVSIDVGKYKHTYFGDYLESANYADYAFGVLLEELKKEGLYDNTAILVFGDHNGLTMYDEDLIDFLKQVNPDITDVDIRLNYTKVACGFRIPGMKSTKIEKPVNKLDIKPTFAYLCNLEDSFSLGTNMFESKDFVSLNNERIITSRYYYDEQWYDIKEGKPISEMEIDEETKKLLDEYYQDMRTELDISNSISMNNLLKQ